MSRGTKKGPIKMIGPSKLVEDIGIEPTTF